MAMGIVAVHRRLSLLLLVVPTLATKFVGACGSRPSLLGSEDPEDRDAALRNDACDGPDAVEDRRDEDAPEARCAVTGVQPDAPWPVVGRDPARSARSPFKGPRSGHIAWSY